MSTKTRKPHALDRPNRTASLWFLIPILLVFLILTLIPLGQSVIWSFTDYNIYTSDFSFVGLENYREVFSDPSLLGGVGFTLLYAIITTFVITVLALPLAVALNRPFFGRDFSRALFFFLGVPSLAILGLVWRYIFSPLDSGVVNSVLNSLGINRLPWLADSGLAKFAVIFVGVWAAVGWHATLYLAYLQSIPKDLYEQATVDGASSMQQFVHITVPQLLPGITVSTFLLISGGLKVYELPFTLTRGGPGYATNTITQSIIERGVGQSDYGVGSALAVLFTIATLVVILGQVALSNVAARRFA
jgi:ABC-type sugar transport systems, permease components